MAKDSAKVTAEFVVPGKLAPQLVEILRGVPSQFPCQIESIVTAVIKDEEPKAPEPEKTPEPKPEKKPGLVKRILGKGK